MNIKRNVEKQLRGWLPEKPRSQLGNKLKGARPIAIAVAATLLIASALLLYPNLLSTSSTLSQLPKPLIVSPVSAATTQAYGQYSMGANILGGDRNDSGSSIKLTSDGGLIMAGTTTSYGSGGSDMWLIKTGLASYTMSNGVTGAYQREQWNVTYGGSKDDGASTVIQTFDGGFAVAGFTYSFGAGGSDMFLVKTTAEGNMQWQMTYGGSGNDGANCLIQTPDGGFLLGGYTNSGVRSQSTWVVKVDAVGNLEWNKTFSGIAANSIIQASDDTYALAVAYPNAFGLITFDISGNTLLDQIYPAPEDQASTQAVVIASDGGYALAGRLVQSSIGVNDTWLVKVDSSGKEQWSQKYPGLGCYSLIKTTEGGYALTGDRAYLIITDSLGNVEWNQIYDEQTGNGSDYYTQMRSLIEASPNHFVMVGVQNSLYWPITGPYKHLQLCWIQVALKSGAETIPPTTTILSPTNISYSTRDVPITFYVNQPTSFLLYRVNGLLNLTLAGNSSLTNLPNGQYDLVIFATDSNFNTAASQTVSFTVNSDEPYVPPSVSIQSPAAQNYTTNQVTLNFSVDQPVLWTAYSLDGGANMTALPNLTLYQLTNGPHTLTVYAGDIEGGLAGSATVNFYVSAFPSPSPYIIPYPPADAGAHQVSQFIRAAAQTFLSPSFLLIAGLFCVFAIGAVVAVLLIERKR